MSQFASMTPHQVLFNLTADPTASDKYFYLLRAPQALTVQAAYMISAATQNAGTAVGLQLEVWGTHGTAVTGTVVPQLGGTATGSRLTAGVPGVGTPTAAQNYIAQNEWLVAHYIEEGAGWVANDRFQYIAEYVYGKGNTTE